METDETLEFEICSATSVPDSAGADSAISKEMQEQLQAYKSYRVVHHGVLPDSDKFYELQTRPENASTQGNTFSELSIRGDAVREIQKMRGPPSTVGGLHAIVPSTVRGTTREDIGDMNNDEVRPSTWNSHVDGKTRPTFSGGYDPSLITPPGSVYSGVEEKTV